MLTGGQRSWYLPVLIVGSALATFLLGVVVTMWLGVVSLSATPAVPPLAEVASNGPAKNQTRPPDGALQTSVQAQTPQPATPAPAQPAAETPVRPSPNARDSGATPASVPATASAAATQPGNYSLQLGGFLDAAKAKSLADQTTARGYTPIAMDAADGYGRTWHYVRLGAFPDERAAALAASDLLERAGIGSVVVRLSATGAGR
jgi:cell division septation protein DedD